MSDEGTIFAGDRQQLYVLSYLSKGDSVTCYLEISNPLHYTPIVPTEELPPEFVHDLRLDILHNAHRYVPGADEYILYVANYRVTLPWPGDMSDKAHLHSVDEGGEIEEYAEYELRVENAE